MQTKTQFQTILDAAKTQNHQILFEIVKTGSSLDEFEGLDTPIKILAFQGEKVAVDFLLREFNCNLNQAVLGYAASGNVVEVNDLLYLGASPDYAVEGYAFNGKFENEITNLVDNKSARFSSAVLGYALAGKTDRVNAAIGEHSDLTPYAIEGYALAGLEKYCDALMSSGKLKDIAISAYARVNNEEKVIAINGHDEHAPAIKGYSEAKNCEKVKTLLISNSDFIFDAIWGFALRGHVKEVNELINFPAKFASMQNLDKMILIQKIESAIKGYASSGYIQQVDFWYERKRSLEKKKKTQEFYLTNSFFNSCFSSTQSALRSFSLLTTDLTTTLEKAYQAKKNFDTTVVSHAQDIKKGLQSSAKLNYFEALAVTDCAIQFLFTPNCNFLVTTGLIKDLLPIIACYLTSLTPKEARKVGSSL